MEENLYTQDSIRTVSGKYVNVFNPDPNTICIEDIAHALSQIPRFGGHLPRYYSVAQHCVSCCTVASEEYKLEALLHDASEAYLLDMPKPIKVKLPDYQEVEENLQKMICKLFNLPFPISAEVKKIDKDMLEFEWSTLMLGKESHVVASWDAQEAKERFISRYKYLINSK